MKTTKKWNKLFLMGMVALALTFGLVMAGCEDPNGSGTPFDDSTLNGTTWVGTQTQDMGEGLSIEIEITSAFTSATEGNQLIKITKWMGDWDDESKAFVQFFIPSGAQPFTYTYDSTAHTGIITIVDDDDESEIITFTVDVAKKEITSTDEDDETFVLKLK
jgi:hypothetical protein